MVTKFVPVPADSGGKQRSLAVLRLLASRGPVTLFAFRDDHADESSLAGLGVEVRSFPRPAGPAVARGVAHTASASAGRFFDPAMAAEVRRTARRADLLMVEYAQMAPYGRGTTVRRVLDLHNVESALMASYARSAAPPRATVAGAEAWALRRIERRALREFDAAVVVSDTDRRRLPVQPGTVLVCPNGVDEVPARPPAARPVAAFVALMGWRPNSDAAVHLVRRVWPSVVARLPDAELLLVGRDPTTAVRGLAGPGIEVTGRVGDVGPYLARARVALAPLLAGGGSRLKILEALVAGRPVVASRVGAEGLEDLVGSGLTVADDPADMAAAIVALLADADAAAREGARGRAAVLARYSWARTLEPLAAALDGAGESTAAAS